MFTMGRHGDKDCGKLILNQLISQLIISSAGAVLSSSTLDTVLE